VGIPFLYFSNPMEAEIVTFGFDASADFLLIFSVVQTSFSGRHGN
jgi:hypothetical protein